jgi:Helix-turn-helix domain
MSIYAKLPKMRLGLTMSNPHPVGRRAGQATGRRRLNGEILDVHGVAELLGCSENFVRARAARHLLPHRRWGGRLIFIRKEILEFLSTYPESQSKRRERLNRNAWIRSGASMDNQYQDDPLLTPDELAAMLAGAEVVDLWAGTFPDAAVRLSQDWSLPAL